MRAPAVGLVEWCYRSLGDASGKSHGGPNHSPAAMKFKAIGIAAIAGQYLNDRQKGIWRKTQREQEEPVAAKQSPGLGSDPFEFDFLLGSATWTASSSSKQDLCPGVCSQIHRSILSRLFERVRVGLNQHTRLTKTRHR
jgi:hypothetical protein